MCFEKEQLSRWGGQGGTGKNLLFAGGIQQTWRKQQHNRLVSKSMGFINVGFQFALPADTADSDGVYSIRTGWLL